jgi:hypothetical protein
VAGELQRDVDEHVLLAADQAWDRTYVFLDEHIPAK